MSKSETLKLLLTKGEEGAVVAVLSRVCYPNQYGEVTPPVMVEHEGQEFLFKKRWMGPVCLYQLAQRVTLDDLLDPQST